VPLIAVIGDRLGCLAAIRSSPEAREFPRASSVTGRYRAVVIGVDIMPLRTGKELRAVLRRIEAQCEVLCGRLSRLEHIFVVVNGSTISEDTVLRICDSTARRIHARLEQSCARSIVLTALLAAHCDDRRSLAERLIARARQRDSLDAGIALHWRDIAHTPIGAVSANTYL